jgi:chromate transporter
MRTQSLFYGIAPAVMAIIAVAAGKLGRMTNRKNARLWVISLAWWSAWSPRSPGLR